MGDEELAPRGNGLSAEQGRIVVHSGNISLLAHKSSDDLKRVDLLASQSSDKKSTHQVLVMQFEDTIVTCSLSDPTDMAVQFEPEESA